MERRQVAAGREEGLATEVAKAEGGEDEAGLAEEEAMGEESQTQGCAPRRCS